MMCICIYVYIAYFILVFLFNSGLRELYNEALQFIRFSLHLSDSQSATSQHHLGRGSLLISGPQGVGKTSLAQAICNSLAAKDYVYIKTLDCKNIRGMLCIINLNI